MKWWFSSRGSKISISLVPGHDSHAIGHAMEILGSFFEFSQVSNCIGYKLGINQIIYIYNQEGCSIWSYISYMQFIHLRHMWAMLSFHDSAECFFSSGPCGLWGFLMAPRGMTRSLWDTWCAQWKWICSFGWFEKDSNGNFWMQFSRWMMEFHTP